MKMLILFVLLAFVVRAETERQPIVIHTEAFLESLAMKETGLGWNGEPGPCGELSKWQITESAWYEEMIYEPFACASQSERARVCVLKRIGRIRRVLDEHGIPATAERIATCWHYGLSHRGAPSAWGQEVANVYDSLSR
jgi:hypothetical protein